MKSKKRTTTIQEDVIARDQERAKKLALEHRKMCDCMLGHFLSETGYKMKDIRMTEQRFFNEDRTDTVYAFVHKEAPLDNFFLINEAKVAEEARKEAIQLAMALVDAERSKISAPKHPYTILALENLKIELKALLIKEK